MTTNNKFIAVLLSVLSMKITKSIPFALDLRTIRRSDDLNHTLTFVNKNRKL